MTAASDIAPPPRFRQLEMLQNPLQRLTIQFCGLVMLGFSAIGALHVALVRGLKMLFFLIAVPTGLWNFIVKLYEGMLQPLLHRLAKVVYKNPDDLTPMIMCLFCTFLVYPALLWNLLYPLDWNFSSLVRMIAYDMMVISYGLDLAFPGVQHHEAHAFWIGGGIVKPEWRFLFDRLGEHWFNPLVGMISGVPTYAHVCVHHKYNANLDDPQTTLWFDRSSVIDFFLLYCPMMMYNRHWGIGAAEKLQATGQYKFADKLMEGQWRYAALMSLCCVLNLQFFLFVMLPIQFMFTTGVTSAEWTMHAFFDAENEEMTPAAATTTFATRKVCYRSEPVHVVHHALNTAGVSRQEKAAEYDQLASYLQTRQSTVPLYLFDFDRIMGDKYQGWGYVFKLLCCRDYQGLAAGLVWTGAGPRPAEEEIIAWIQRSVKPVDVREYSLDRLQRQQLIGAVNLDGKSGMMKAKK